MYARLIGFTSKIKLTAKPALLNLYYTVKNDCRSITGRNLRKIMLQTKNNYVDDITIEEIKALQYRQIPAGEEWKIALVEEMTNNWFNCVSIPGFKHSEINEILEYVCSS